MHYAESRLVFAATDLSSHSECARRTHLEILSASGLLEKPGVNEIERRMLEKRGHEHEARVLDYYRARGLEIVSIPLLPGAGDRAQRGAQLTEAAMANGAELIYQGVLFDDTWFGRPDFLIKTPGNSRFGGYCYEAVDAKLARESSARAVLQLCFYTDQLARLQDGVPERFWVVTGQTEIAPEPFSAADYMALFRWARREFEAQTRERGPEPYPEPVEHCGVCRWWKQCETRRRADDHLSLVAGITRRQRDRLALSGITRVVELAALEHATRIEGLNPDPLWRVREQARVQTAGRASTEPLYELLLDAETGAGLESLPEPSPGDVFLDLEGDAFVADGGLEYLFGIVELTVEEDPFSFSVSAPEPVYHAFWATDRAQEKRAFVAVMDRIMARRRERPSMHVYHFGQREADALKRLACRHAVREEEVDELLRGGALVDLHRVARQGIRAAVESYSLKELERFHGFERGVSLRDAAMAMQWFGWHLESGDISRDISELRSVIEHYNRDDCFSTLRLQSWLEARRSELGRYRVLTRPTPVDDKPNEKREHASAETARVAALLFAKLPEDGARTSTSEVALACLAHLLDWHWREAKSAWWEYYRARDLPRDERLEDRSVLDKVEYQGQVGSQKRSTLHQYVFPPQEHGIRRGSADDPDTTTNPSKAGSRSQKSVNVVEVGPGYLIASKGKTSAPDRFTSLIPGKPLGTDAQQKRLLELGQSVAEFGIDGPGPFRAARDLLLRKPPRVGRGDGQPLVAEHEDAGDALCQLALALDHSVLAVQGPPGSGKTHRAAQMILALLASGKRVGVTANSHKVIVGVLEKVVSLAKDRPLARILHIGEEEEDAPRKCDFEFSKDYESVNTRMRAGELNLIGGTCWAWCREEFAGALDVLVVDEAGQLSLANVLAASHAAESLVLFGDPAQLEQPQRGVHPEGADASALEHLLGDELTMPPERGVFLPHSRRLHPDICRFTSEVFYANRLASLDPTKFQRVDGPAPFSGTGLRFVAVEHQGNTNSAEEEVARIGDLVEQLLAGRATFTDSQQRTHVLTESDVLVVAPYNAQVTALRRRLPPAMSVGTVDKFQGREAPIVIYSLTSSSAEDAPRGLEFLYNLNRLNVATSRAQALVVLVGSAKLVQARGKTPRQMKLVNALCRYLELARDASVVTQRFR